MADHCRQQFAASMPSESADESSVGAFVAGEGFADNVATGYAN